MAKERKAGRNRDSGKKRRGKTAKVNFLDKEGPWGKLPSELRQRLIDLNIKSYTPEFEAEIKAYYKRIAKKQ